MKQTAMKQQMVHGTHPFLERCGKYTHRSYYTIFCDASLVKIQCESDGKLCQWNEKGIKRKKADDKGAILLAEERQ